MERQVEQHAAEVSPSAEDMLRIWRADRCVQDSSAGLYLQWIKRFRAHCAQHGLDERAELIEHEVGTMVGQRIFGIALGYEDLVDHDQLRHDPALAVLAGKLAARRKDCARWPANRRSTGWSSAKRR
jgi:hypothetical protein